MTDRITNHVTIVATLNIVVGAMHLIAAALIAYNIYVVGVSSEFPGMAKGLMVVMGIGGLVYVLVGIALVLRIRLARPVALILDALILFEFPVGTPVGLYAIWLFVFRDTDSYFAKKKPTLSVYSESD